MRRRSFALASVFLAPLLIAAAPDTFTRADLDALEAERRAAVAQLARLEAEGAAVVTDLRALDESLLTTALESRRREEQASQAELTLAALAIRRKEARAELRASEATLEDLLAALAAANRRKPPALVVSPDNSGNAIRRAILLRATYPQLAARASAIADEITELNQIEDGIIAERARLAAAEATLALKREEIERLAASKRAAFEGLAGDLGSLRAHAEQLGREAGTLRELLAALERAAPEAPGVKPDVRPQLASVKTSRTTAAGPAPSKSPRTPSTAPLGRSVLGGLKVPVSGKVLYGFGDTLPSGAKTEYVVYATRSKAQVSAPVAGEVVFARPFRTYGNMLILRTSDGYHVILSGLSRIYVAEGQTVSAGEPVGRMPERDDPPPELAVELRLGDRVLDPAEWMVRDE